MKIIDRYLILINLLWVVFIFILCATPGQYIPSFTWLDLLSFDKLVHASIFYILNALFFINCFKRNKNRNFFILFLLIGIFYGIILEGMQATLFVNRTADWIDIIADTFGCVLAYLLRFRIFQFYTKITNPHV